MILKYSQLQNALKKWAKINLQNEPHEMSDHLNFGNSINHIFF